MCDSTKLVAYVMLRLNKIQDVVLYKLFYFYFAH